MDRLIIALAIALALLFSGATGMHKALGAQGGSSSDTSVTVGLVSKTSGLIPAVVLSWGSASETIVVKTNSAKGYRLTARAVSLQGGLGISLSDVKVELRKVYGMSRAYAFGNTAGSTGRTDKWGDVYEIRVSVWQPLGSPTITLAYNYEVIR